MTKTQFKNLKKMMASENVDDINLAGKLLEAFIFNKEKKVKLTKTQYYAILNAIGTNSKGLSPDDGTDNCWLVDLLKSRLV